MSQAAAALPLGRFDLRIVTSVEEWDALEADWDRLLRVTPGCTALQSFDFLRTWWAEMAGDRRLWIAVFLEGSAIVGIAPLQIEQRKVLGRSYRVLQLIGMTEDVLLPTVLVAAERAAALRAALVRALAERRAEWDLLELDEIAADDPLIDAVAGLAQDLRYLYRCVPFHPCPHIDLRGHTVESFFRQRSSKLRKNLRASERKLAQHGAISLDVRDSPAAVLDGWRAFAEVARRSWKEREAIGLASDARYERFYERLLDRFARRHGARVLLMRAGEQLVAGTVAVIFDRVYYSLQIAHDERFAPCSPGTLLESYELERLLEDGSADRYEMLGGALSNKVRWATGSVATVRLAVTRPDARTRALDGYEFAAKPLAKRVIRGVRAFVAARREGAR